MHSFKQLIEMRTIKYLLQNSVMLLNHFILHKYLKIEKELFIALLKNIGE